MNQFSRYWLASGLAILIGSGWLAADDDTVRDTLPASWHEDAELVDVYFVDANLGWAVGAQGTIVRTRDGGKSWLEISQAGRFLDDEMTLEEKIRSLQAGRGTSGSDAVNQPLQNRPLSCHFNTIHFVDANRGWVAGEYQLPYVDRSRAVLLRTEDGGATWSQVDDLMIPGIRKIRFDDFQNGWAIGAAGNLYSSGIFFTNNGGSSWSSQTSEISAGWRDAQRQSDNLVTIDPAGNLGHFQNQKYEPAVVLGLPAGTSQSEFARILMTDAENGIAVGAGGLCARTANGGKSWQSLSDTGSAPWLTQIDLTSVAVGGARVWMVGDPGTCLVSIDPATGQIGQVRSPVNSRLNQVFFADANSGWAVGENGVILATTDGGNTWDLQRGLRQTAAMMFITPDPQGMPLELLARYAVEDHRVCSLVVLHGEYDEFLRIRQAAERLGCGSARLLSSASGGANPANPDRMRQLVRCLRTNQPSVVVCQAEQGFGTPDPVGQIREAIRLAADEQAFPEQLRVLGLPAHQVARLVVSDPAGSIQVNPQRLLARRGELVEDRVALSRALLGLSIVDAQPARYRVVDLLNFGSLRGDDLCSGLGGGIPIPTRSDHKERSGNLAAIRAASEKAKRMEQFIQFDLQHPQDVVVWRRQVEQYTAQLDPQIASSWMMQLAQQYQRAGKMELAAEAAQLLVTRWPESTYTLASLSWLIRYYASDEFGHLAFQQRMEFGVLDATGESLQATKIESRFTTAPQVTNTPEGSRLVWTPVQVQSRPEVVKASAEAADPDSSSAEADSGLPLDRPDFFDQRLQIAARLLTALGQRDPDLAADPCYRWMEASLTRRLIESGIIPRTNNHRFESLAQLPRVAGPKLERRSVVQADVAQAAEQELKLIEALAANNGTEAADEPVRPVLVRVCQPAPKPPHLDGRLDEAWWQEANLNSRFALPFRNPLPATTSLLTPMSNDSLRLACDDEYLYLGLQCQKLPGVNYQWDRKPRPRDADLTRRDRVSIRIDVDRDYDSCFELEVDHRGWVHDACGNFESWDPTWFVSQSETSSQWTIEAAIPLTALVPNQMSGKTVWAIESNRLAGDLTPTGFSSFQVRPMGATQFQLFTLDTRSR